MKQVYSILTVLLLLIASSVHAQNIPQPMSPPRLVNDFAKLFSTEQQRELEQILLAYNDSTSTQIYVVTVTDLDGYAPSEYATELGNKWKIGKKDKDNGAVILIKPRIGNERGQVFISTGYGLEGTLNDARIGRIIDNYMVDPFRAGDYYAGTRAAVMAMIGYLSGEFQADKEDLPKDDSSAWIITAIIFVLVIILSARGGGSNNRGGGNRSSRGGFFPPVVPRSGGSFGGGGGFGGGFSGGGGGSFGGGGAGRSF